MSCKSFCWVVLLVLGTLGAPTWAQNITGSISGIAKDPTGAVVANATVVITNTDTGLTVRTLKTDGAGEYSAPLLPIGHYKVTVEASGFKTFVRQNIELNVNDKLTVNAALQVGSTTESVLVEGTPLQVDLNSATATGLVDGTQI